MKFRFALTNVQDGFSKKDSAVTFIAFDTCNVTAWLLATFKHDSNGLELWFKGVSESILIKEEDVGSPVFQLILNFLGSEFPDIEQLKIPEPSIKFEDEDR